MRPPLIGTPLLALLLAVISPLGAEAPPIEFALDEFRKALKETGRSLRIRTEVSTAAPETYRISAYQIQGGDLRGLMYGLLAGADQIRRHGRLVPERGAPAVPIRGIRRFVHNHDLEEDWYYSRDYWRDYIQMLARNRFNRLNLVFAHQTAYLAPPYPFWVEVEEFPEVRVPRLSADARQRNHGPLFDIGQTAADHAIDFTLGVWEHDIQHGRQTPSIEGLTAENVGPYSYLALKKVLAACPAIRSLQIRTNWESGIPPERQVEFYRDYIYKALREAGRMVTLDLRGWLMSEGMLNAAIESGVPMRLSSKYWAEHIGRPYQPAETRRNYSYINFLRRWEGLLNGRARPYDFFWEIWGLGSHRLLLWGDPDFVKRVASTLTISDSRGFEIDEPLAQKGYGNRPGKWGIFAEGQGERRFWKWEFERYWLFYRLWGRLAYDPKTNERAWMEELAQRFDEAAGDVLDAYQHASRVLGEIVAVHMPDPNMYMWPEINPNGLIDYYAAVDPSDRRLVASFQEVAENQINGTPSAKQTPRETAERLRSTAAEIEAALKRVGSKLPADHQEWMGSQPDFAVLAMLARFHARRQLAAERLTWFYQTADRAALNQAREELTAGLKIWEQLASFTDGLYPPHMAYGPEDVGHWKDKLPFLQHDLTTIQEREWLLDRFGQFQIGLDFGAEPGRLQYRQLIHTSLEPRFLPVDPGSAYTEERGFGWVGEGERTATVLADADKRTVRATASSPRNLPENALFGDSIRGRGPQTFRVRTGPGEFLVSRLYPDGNASTTPREARNGVVDIVMPADDWEICGIIVKSVEPDLAPPNAGPAEPAERPTIFHAAPTTAVAGRPLALSLRITPPSAAANVKLHYRPLNALEQFRTLEAPPEAARFTIPAEELSREWDILYYFELLADNGSGWFHPDPDERTPYYLVTVSGTPAR